MLKAIIFDLDNTLLDFWKFKTATAQAAAKQMRKHGWKLSEKETVKRIFVIYQEKGIEYQKTFADLVYGAGYQGNKAERIQQAAIITYNRAKFSILKPYPGAKSMLSSLKRRHKLAVLSDGPRNKVWQRLILAGLDGFFDEVGTFHDTSKAKPDRAPFLRICRLLKAKPSECLFVGDNPERDIAGAKSVGMMVVWARYGHVYGKKNGLQDATIKKPMELVKIVGVMEKR